MRARLRRILTWPRVLVFFAAYLALQHFLLTAVYPVITPAPELLPLDLRPVYDAEQAYRYLGAIGADGRDYYRQNQIVTDMLFAGFYALAYAGLLIRLAERAPRRLEPLWVGALFPLAAGLADVGENLLLVRLLGAYPAELQEAAAWAGRLTAGKHILAGLYALTLGALVAGILGQIFAALARRWR